jgi:hypothetical protein
MAPKAEKAGPVTGTDLRNTDLTITSDNSHSMRSLQVARLTRRCAVTAMMAAILAPLVFEENTR